MNPKLDVLVVDDSAIYRSLIQGCLREIRDVRCVGTAKDGKDAVARARELAPDLILLDVEMPVMNGLEAIPALRRAAPHAGIIMVSSVTTEGADVTLEALQAGAFEFVTKPQVKAGEDGFAALRRPLELVIETFREARQQRTRATTEVKLAKGTGKAPRIDVVAVGVSTGGPSALAEVIPALPGDFPAPVVIVQHMPPRFTASLATSLDRKSSLRVLEANDGRPLRGGEVLIAPGGNHMVIEANGTEPFVKLTQSAPINSFRPSVDVLLRSVAKTFPGHALTVMMTGMGSDGFEGVCEVRAAGGYSLAQDRASCAVYGMPRAVIEGGAADEVVALADMAARIGDLVRRR